MWSQPASQLRQRKEQSTQLRDLFLFPVSTVRPFPSPHSKQNHDPRATAGVNSLNKLNLSVLEQEWTSISSGVSERTVGDSLGFALALSGQKV